MAVHVDQALYAAYYKRENREPLVGFTVSTYYPLHRYRGAQSLPDGLYTPSDLDISAYLDDYDRLYDLHAACPGDLVWAAAAFWGVPWMEAALGCQVEADHTTGSSRAYPQTETRWPEVPEFSLANPWVARCLEMLDATAAHARGRFPLAVSLMRGVSDVLNALLGLERTILAMLDTPDRIHELAQRIADFWISFSYAQLDAVPPYDGGYGAFLYNLWAPGGCAWLQEDAAALLSPELYREFILPYDRQIAQAFDYCCVHMHPARYIPHEPLADTDVKALELHIDRGGPSARELLPIYRAILAHKPLLVWGDVSDCDLQVLLTELDPGGLAIQIAVDSPEQAQEIYRRHMR
jgi:hypothetical protein